MGISELRQVGKPAEKLGASESYAAQLVRNGVISASDMALVQLVQKHCDAPLESILLAEGLTDEDTLLKAHAARLTTRCVSPADMAGLPTRDTAASPGDLLRAGALPVTDRDGMPATLTHRPITSTAAPPGRMLIAPRKQVQSEIARRLRTALTQTAQARVPEVESCRTWSGRLGLRLGLTLGLLGLVCALTFAFPLMVFTIFAFWAALTLVITISLKLAAFIARISQEDKPPQPNSGPVAGAPLPRVSIMVPLFRETEIAHALIARLQRLTYPKCLLDVILVLEEEDDLTRQTLAQIDLPPWMRAVVVPDGQPRTKPRAMNYALDFCEGDIIGIFDAEDAPAPDQITAVARRFQQAPPDVVCLQGILDYYNPRQNWLARCFTIEYAAWFRMIMPGMARLGFAIPLGGTTLYFRRDILEKLGGWDAHNVTEDADLGFRLARHGYRTEMIATVTGEEANCHLWPWIKQRSRWLKGYMTTYLVHMRHPRRLYRQLGAWKFWGFQAHFVSALSQVLLAPVLWSFWLVLFALPHPMDWMIARDTLVILCSLFLIVEILGMVIYAAAVSGRDHRHLMWWVPTMHFYAPLAAIAAYKALYELVLKPFFWDKTVHGLSLKAGAIRRSDNAVDLT
ncbi:MAG: glycosyltransferase [Pseudomonadota bacterium]|uniref:glycosyltransferase n=1 Tax=Roseovarius TaxID=74030 RepID=UPI0022A86095|nr:glycosyltransferase [Roseovarius sp. EGI FJ00037]MCZ0812816.1 glycosyltransferase [Roseovarius sp. EGI FJ00037]